MADPLKPGEVAVFDRLGRRFVGPATGLKDALNRGFRPETQEEAAARVQEEKYGDRPIAAGAAGAARAATLGLSDYGLTESGLVEGEDLRGLREANQAASIAGEVVGTGVSLLTPGLGVANVAKGAMRAGQLAERGAALLLKGGAEKFGGKLATKAAGGIVEGSLYGAGSALTEASLGDEELTAEKIVSHMGLGAVFGGGASGSLEALLSRRLLLGGGKAVARSADNFAPGLLDDAAEVVTPGRLADDAASASALPAPGLPPGASGARATEEAATSGEPLVDTVLNAAKNPKAAGEFLESTTKKYAGKVKEVFEGLGLTMPTPEELVLRDLDFKKKASGLLREKGLAEDAPRLLLDDARYANAKTAEQKIDLLETKQGEFLKDYTSALKQLDETSPGGAALNVLDVAVTIDEQVLGRLRQSKNLNKSSIGKIEGLLEDMLDKGENIGLQEAERLKRQIDPYLRWDSPLKDDNVALGAMREARDVLNKKIAEGARLVSDLTTGGRELADRFTQGKRNYGAINELLHEGESRLIDAKQANRVFGLTDNMAGGIAGGVGLLTAGPAGLVMAGGAAMLTKWGRERLPHILALHLHAIQSKPGVGRVAKSFHESIESLLLKSGPSAPPASATAPGLPPAPGVPGMAQAGAQAVSEGVFGRFTAPLSAAAARGVASLWATHHALASLDPEYPATMQQAGFPTESPEGVLEVMRKAERLDATQALVDAQNTRIDKALDAFLEGRKPTTKASSVGGLSRVSFGLDKAKAKGVEAYEKRLGELARLAGDPEALTEALAGMTGPLNDSAPGVASSMALVAARAAGFLHEKAPKPPPEVVPGVAALSRKWQPSEQELSRWERYLAAVAEPEGVLRDLRAGTVTREAVEGLKAVYPKLHADIQQRMMERLAGRKDALEYGKRLTLSQLFGVPLDEAMRPERVAALQASFLPGGQQANAPTPGKRVDVAGGDVTQAQRLQARGA